MAEYKSFSTVKAYVMTDGALIHPSCREAYTHRFDELVGGVPTIQSGVHTGHQYLVNNVCDQCGKGWD